MAHIQQKTSFKIQTRSDSLFWKVTPWRTNLEFDRFVASVLTATQEAEGYTNQFHERRFLPPREILSDGRTYTEEIWGSCALT